MNFGTLLKEYRTSYGMTRGELGRRVGITFQYVHQLEAQRALHPSAQIVERIIEVLRLSQEEGDRLRSEADAVRPIGRPRKSTPIMD